MTGTLAGRIALITGASRGIGRAAALAFAKEGAHVIALARTSGALEELDDAIRSVSSAGATLVPADLKDHDGLDRLGAAIYERWGRLDIFFGNGAILGPITPLGHVTTKDWDDTIAVNVTANFRLLRILDPLLKRSDAGRVILMSSAAAWKHRPYWGCYSMSKAALEALGHTYAQEVESTPVKVMMVDPGPLRTDMRATAVPGEDPNSLREPEMLAPHLVEMAAASWMETGKLFDFSGHEPAIRQFGKPV
jgi:NAD(P)-dependent dehydrogenase (short-subunit alcohol dehydrogenase family)